MGEADNFVADDLVIQTKLTIQMDWVLTELQKSIGLKITRWALLKTKECVVLVGPLLPVGG